MAEALKNIYNPLFFETICPQLQQSIPGFECRGFIFRVFNNEWPDLELKQRVRHITLALHEYLPKDFTKASLVLMRLSDRLRAGGSKIQGFACMFIPDYVEVFGRQHPDEALTALETITKLVSAEFAVRPFIIQDTERTMKKMFEWSRSEDANIRRLASEGCRPRLPWGIGLSVFKTDPRPILPILENLKNDPSGYVRRSVANNLNDIAKDHPEIVLNLATTWKGVSKETDWILKHGCRSLLKRGDKKILAVHGFNSSDKARITSLHLSRRKINCGDELFFEFGVENLEKSSKNFRIEYAIDYITATGKVSTKTFKVSEKILAPSQPVVFKRKQSFRDLTTRKHYKGRHQLYVLANGKKLGKAEFTVC